MTQSLTRDVAVDPRQTALIFIDVQNYATDPAAADFRALPPGELAKYDYYFQRLRDVALPNMQLLQKAARNAGVEIIYAVIENLTKDGRDRGLDYKISGINVAKGSWEARVSDAIAPGEDEIVLRKNSSSVFISTNIDYLLRSLGMRQVILCGLLTDQCVESAVRDACDLGYLVTLVPDACATYTVERQEASVRAIKGYCRQRDTRALLAELVAQ
jgi:nicotinamidase-related amidase